jgi:hypothetical protein
MREATSATSGPPGPKGTDPGLPARVAEHPRSVLKHPWLTSARSAISGAAIPYLLCLTGCLLIDTACRHNAPPSRDERLSSGAGPEQYSARVVRTVEQDGRNDSVESRICVSGQMIREDWAEQGEKRALIIRPDLGESYLLFLDKGEYIASGLNRDAQFPAGDGATQIHRRDNGPEPPTGDSTAPQVDPVAIESDMSPGAAAANVTDQPLPDASIDNHPCKVSERRVILPDGTTEITRTYKAKDLSGMTIRTESESDGKGRHLRVVTEWRDIQTAVLQAVFDLPTGFRKRDA